jgi:hypothetical protein
VLTLLRSEPAKTSPISIGGLLVPPRVALWFARVWISTVIVGSLLPGSAKITLFASESEHMQSGNAVTSKHRLIHFFAFGSSFFLLSLLAAGRREQLEAAGEVMAIGCMIELIQYFAYSHGHAAFEWWDVRDDAIGIVAAFLLVQIVSGIDASIGSRP